MTRNNGKCFWRFENLPRNPPFSRRRPCCDTVPVHAPYELLSPRNWEIPPLLTPNLQAADGPSMMLRTDA